MAQHIGIVAVSPEGSALCYRLILAKAAQHGLAHPSVSLHNRPFPLYMEAFKRGDWTAVGMLLQESALALAAGGAEFCILPDNVAHQALQMVVSRSPIPWLSMIDLVAEAVINDRRTTVGLVGTRYVTYGSTYQTMLGIKGVKVLIPPEDEADELDRIIFDELVVGKITRPSRDRLAHALDALGKRGCEGVICGCTELPLLFEGGAAPLPLYDSVDLLADAAVRKAAASA